MSLISQKDRQRVIEALDFYLESLDDLNQKEKMELNALSNWIRLEYFKNQPPQ